MIEVLRAPFEKAGVTITETVRVAALNIKPGVTSDEGDGDDWPGLRAKILSHDILIFAGPNLDGPSRQRRQTRDGANGRLSRGDQRQGPDAELEQSRSRGDRRQRGRCAYVDLADLPGALNEVGWTIPAIGAVYWVGEAYGGKDFKDLLTTPAKVTESARQVAGNAAHLAGLLKATPLSRLIRAAISCYRGSPPPRARDGRRRPARAGKVWPISGVTAPERTIAKSRAKPAFRSSGRDVIGRTMSAG